MGTVPRRVDVLSRTAVPQHRSVMRYSLQTQGAGRAPASPAGPVWWHSTEPTKLLYRRSFLVLAIVCFSFGIVLHWFFVAIEIENFNSDGSRNSMYIAEHTE